MKIPFVDLSAQYNRHKEAIDKSVNRIIRNASFVGGPEIKAFESAFAEANGVKNCIAVANGTDAIYITLKMLGIGPGDEVITTALSWISTSETISQTGAKPVFVDINPNDYTINTELIESKITAHTKAIIPVHLYGQPAEMRKINSICNKHNLLLIEDCAQAHFAHYQGQIVGSFGDAATFSFYPGKNLGAYGDAGAILTNNNELANKCRMYANHGALVKHHHMMEGINSRMDSLQAAILNVKLPFINEWNDKRRQNAAYYNEILKEIPQIKTGYVNPNTSHIYHVYCIRAEKRNALQSFLSKHEIQTAIHYPIALPNMPAYSYLGNLPDDFPVASNYQDTILSLPMYPELRTEQMLFVAQQIKEFYKLANFN